MTKFPQTANMLGGIKLVVGLGLLLGLGMTMGNPVVVKAAFIGWMFWTCVTFGMFGMTLFHHTVRGKWGAPIVRLWEAGGGWLNLVVMGLLGALLLNMGRGVLYPFLTPENIAHDPTLKGRGMWLDDTMIWARYTLYFGLPAVWAYLNQKWLRLEEQTGDKVYSDRRTNFSAPGLAMFCLVINFWATDIGMMLDPHWFSQIYGIWFVGKMALMALSFGVFVLCSQANKAPYAGRVSHALTKDLGNLLFAFTMLWGYFSLSQFLIIWSPNMPEFNVYYLARSVNGYNMLGMVNIMGSFFIPFLAMVAPATKRSLKLMTFWSAWIFTFSIVDILYVLLPSLQPVNWLPVVPVVLGGILAFGGLWFFMFAFRVKQAKLLTEPHPYKSMEEAGHAHA